MKKITLGIFILLSFTINSFALAQVSATITLEPKNPNPKSVVTLSFESYSFDVNTAMISWTVDGKKVLQGDGEKKLQLKTGEIGDTISVTVTASTLDGYEVSQSITISPASVILIYEAPQSYVPLLYEGRSLPGEGALVKVTALPLLGSEGKVISPSKLSYTWYINDTVFKNASGLGKQSTFMRLDYLENKNTVKVVVRSPYGNTAEKTISIYTHDVMPLVYTYNTIFGADFTKIVERRFEAVKDFTLSLQPFYVSDEDKNPASFVWYLDGLPATPLGGRLLELHPKEDSYGSKILSLDVYGSDRRLQKAQTKVEILFDTRK